MKPLKLLVVEDNLEELETCRASVARYRAEKLREINLVECTSLDQAINQLDNSFDGAIVDLKLAREGNEGTAIIKSIVDSYFRIPIAVFTGTPDSIDPHFAYVGVFKKGETKYVDIFDILWGIHDTGLTRIMGGRGVIESTLNQVFLKNILPQRESWVKHGTADSARTEKALLRHTLNHLMQLLDGHDDVFYPEEVYIFPPVSEGVFTGSVVKLKSAEQWFVVLNPACDLVVRANGHFKADRLFLVGIESEEAIVKAAVVDIVKKEKRQKKLKDVFGNNENGYYHWLPKTKFFSGGFINFRNVHSILKEKLVADFNTPGLQISPPFVKDIVSRFSSYYARQGQPEIDSEFRIDELTT